MLQINYLSFLPYANGKLKSRFAAGRNPEESTRRLSIDTLTLSLDLHTFLAVTALIKRSAEQINVDGRQHIWQRPVKAPTHGQSVQ